MPEVLTKPKIDPSIVQLNTLHPLIRKDAIAAYKEAVRLTPNGVHPVINEGLRSFARSNQLYAQGRTKPGPIVTNAKAGQSLHNFALAVDFFLLINGKDVWTVEDNWMIVVKCFKDKGFTWGGDFKGRFKDFPHLEKTNGLTWKQCLAKYNRKDFIPGTTYINI